MSEIAAKRVGISLDPLAIKRIKSIDETGKEEPAEEPSIEEKFLLALGRIDFHHAIPVHTVAKGGEEDEKEREKKKKEAAAKASSQSTWQWQSVVEHFQMVQIELGVIQDVIKEVEANNAVTLAYIPRPRPLMNEKIQELALRVSQKRKQMQVTARYLRKTAQGLGKQVAKEGLFYGALMRLQQNWKVKRSSLRGIGPVVQSGGALVNPAASSTSGFSIDLSWSLVNPENKLVSSLRPPPIANIVLTQDSAGKLTGSLGSNRTIRIMRCHLTGIAGEREVLRPARSSVSKDDIAKEKDEDAKSSGFSSFDWNDRYPSGGYAGRKKREEGVEIGAEDVHALLRRVQSAVYCEQFFEAMGRELLAPGSGMTIVDMSDSVLEVSVGHGSTIRLSLEALLTGGELSRSESQETPARRDQQAGKDPGLGHWTAKHSTGKEPAAMEIDGTLSKSEEEEDGKAKWRGPALLMRPRSKAVSILFKQAFHRALFSDPKGGQLPLLSTVSNVSGPGPRTSDLASGAGGMSGAGGLSGVKGRAGGLEAGGQGGPVGIGGGAVDATRSGGVDGRGSSSLSASFSRLVCGILSHQVYAAKVQAALEQQTRANHYLRLFCLPTWHHQVSAWELSLCLPNYWIHIKGQDVAARGMSTVFRGRACRPILRPIAKSSKEHTNSASNFQNRLQFSMDREIEEEMGLSTVFKCIVIVRDERIYVEGIHGMIGSVVQDGCFLEGVHVRGSLIFSIPEMESFIVNQVIGHMSQEPIIPF